MRTKIRIPKPALALLSLLAVVACRRNLDDCRSYEQSLLLNLTFTVESSTFIRPFLHDFRTGSGAQYDMRFILDVYPENISDPTPADRLQRIVRYADRINVAGNNLELSFDAPHQKVRMLVWADFVVSGSETDLYYDTHDLRRVTVKSPARWGELHKAAFEGSIVIDPSVIVDRLSVLNVPMEMPLGYCRIITTDVPQYRALAGVPPLESLATEAKYQLWLPWSYDVLTRQVVATQGNVTFTSPISEISTQEAVLVADFVFVSQARRQGPVDANALFDFTTSGGSAVVALWQGAEVGLIRGDKTELRGRWLTSPSGAGITVDPGFGGEITFEIPD